MQEVKGGGELGWCMCNSAGWCRAAAAVVAGQQPVFIPRGGCLHIWMALWRAVIHGTWKGAKVLGPQCWSSVTAEHKFPLEGCEGERGRGRKAVVCGNERVWHCLVV